MKHFKLLSALFFVSALLIFGACTEECEKEGYGSVTITNNTGEYWVFDVTFNENSDGSWETNEEVTIYDGESYTFEEIDEGEVAIWASDPFTSWEIATTVNVSACDDYSYNPTQKCELFNTAVVTVINGGDFALAVDVKDEDGWINEYYLSAGSEVDYTIEYGDVVFAAMDYWNGTSWTYSDTYTVGECETFDFTWNGKKMAEGSKGQKEDIPALKVVKPTKAGSAINFDELPAK